MNEFLAFIERHPWWTLFYLTIIFNGPWILVRWRKS